jgi:hypothetical protein
VITSTPKELLFMRPGCGLLIGGVEYSETSVFSRRGRVWEENRSTASVALQSGRPGQDRLLAGLKAVRL